MITKDFLIQEYVQKNKTMLEIAVNIECSKQLIYYYLIKYNIDRRPIGGSLKGIKANSYVDGRTLKQYYCIDCNKEISVDTALYKQGRCKSCETKRRFKKGIMDNSGEKNWNWQNGKSLEIYPSDWTEILKESIRQRDNHICQICSKTQIDNGEKLSVHHIDYDKDNLDPENLTSLCRSCHGKTYKNKDKWICYFKKQEGVYYGN